MPMIIVFNIIDDLNGDSGRDALSARMGKVLREMIELEGSSRSAGDNALWAALRQEIQDRKDAVNAERTARDDAVNALWTALRQEIQDRKDADAAEKMANDSEIRAIWTKLGDLWFEDIRGKLSGTRVYALEGNERS